MDQSFFLRAQRLLDRRQPARLDHDLLVASIAARQAASPTVRAQRRCDQAVAHRDAQAGAPLDAILLGETGWEQAVRAQRGRFTRLGEAAVNGA